MTTTQADLKEFSLTYAVLDLLRELDPGDSEETVNRIVRAVNTAMEMRRDDIARRANLNVLAA